MSNFIVIDGDRIQFIPQFDDSTVAVQPGTISGTGHATISGKKVCLTNDITSVTVAGVSYITAAYPFPGTGTLTIRSLRADQQKNWCQSTSPVIVVGATFIAQFQTTVPAKAPPPASTPDPTPLREGTGSIINSQFFVTAS